MITVSELSTQLLQLGKKQFNKYIHNKRKQIMELGQEIQPEQLQQLRQEWKHKRSLRQQQFSSTGHSAVGAPPVAQQQIQLKTFKKQNILRNK